MPMIQFTCPGCSNTHSANDSFAGLRARCVVCGVSIRIPKTNNAVAEALAPLAGVTSGRSQAATSQSTKPVRKAAPKPVILSPEIADDGTADAVFDDPLDLSPTNIPAMKVQPKKATPLANEKTKKLEKTKKKKDSKANPDAETEPDADEPISNRYELTEDIEDGTTDEAAAATEAKQRLKQRLIIGGVLAVAIAIVAYVSLGSSEEDRSKSSTKTVAAVNETTPSTPITSAKTETPPGKIEDKAGKKDEKKVEKKDSLDLPIPELAPLPHLSINEPLPITTARLLLEYSDNPAAFDEKYRRQVFLVQGTCLSVNRESLILADDGRGNAGRRQLPILVVCKLPKPQDGEKLPAGVSAPNWPSLQPGQPIAVRGTYLGLIPGGNDEPERLQLGDCAMVQTMSPGDVLYRGKELELSGFVRQFIPLPDEGTQRFSTIVFEPPTTDCPIVIRCLFRQTDQEGLAKIEPGAWITVRGICAGRTGGTVTLHNCVVIGAQNSPPSLARSLRVTAEQLFTDYERDLLPGDRPAPGVNPILVGSANLAEKFVFEPAQAIAQYRFKNVEVTGRVLDCISEARTVVLETGTNHQVLLAVIFTPKQFALLKLPDRKSSDPLTVRGVCVGVGPVPFKKRGTLEEEDSKAVRIENASWHKLEKKVATTETVAEFFPIKPGLELTYDVLTVTRPKDNSLLRLQVRFAEENRFVATPLRSGTWPAATLFGQQPLSPKWLKDLTKQKSTPQTTQYQIYDGAIETRDVPAPPNQPSAWWDPVFRFGVALGESWSSKHPDGRTVTYTVQGFDKDVMNRPLVEIRRVMKYPNETSVWEETRIFYVLGVGETKRIVTRHAATGQSFTILEMRLVEPGPDAKEPEKKEPPIGLPKPSDRSSQPK